MDKKGVSGGMVTTLIFGMASLVIAFIIAFVISQTLGSSDLLGQNRATGTTNLELANFNTTTNYTLAGVNNITRTGYTIVAIMNATNNVTFSATNYSLTKYGILYPTASGLAGEGFVGNVYINYTYQFYTNEELADTNLRGNFSSGANNVSAKVPTVLLIGAIVLILSVLAVLVGVWRKMNFGSGSTV